MCWKRIGGRRQQLMFAAPPEIARKVEKLNGPQFVVNQDLFANKLYRAVYSNRQLEEVLDDFWFNHFNVFLDKGADRYLVTDYERDAIRPHVLGQVPRSAGGHGARVRPCCSIWITGNRWADAMANAIANAQEQARTE